MTINNKDFPALFKAADKASSEAQIKYTRWIAIGVTLAASAAILAAIHGFVALDYKIWKIIISFFISLMLIASIIITFYLESRKFQKDWYDGRAVAESVKTIAWRFMVKSDPYGENLGIEDASKEFLDIVGQIVSQRREFINRIQNYSPSSEQITQKMKSIRNLSFSERKNLYIMERIENQRIWYETKSKLNKNSTDNWVKIIIGLQFLALISALMTFVLPDVAINSIGALTTLASSALAWLQLKRHQDLYNSYAVAAGELGIIKEQGDSISDPTKFSLFVSDAENAISREHTLWAARRDSV